MKKILLLILVLVPSSAFAGTGSSIAPHWWKANNALYTSISVSNVSTEQVTVYIKLFNRDGNLYEETTETGQNINIEGNFSGDPLSTSGATLDASKVGAVRIYALGSSTGGYATIEWYSSTNNTSSLVGFVNRVDVRSNGENESNLMLLNAGLPF